MRIAYVCADRGISATGCNGAATHVREFVNALAARGADVKILMPQPARGAGVACELIHFETEPLPSKLRRLTARIEGTDEATGQASELHGLILNQLLRDHLVRLHLRWPIELVYERQSLWSYAGLEFARHHDLPFFLEVNAPLVAQQEHYRALYNAAAARALETLLLRGADRVVVPSKVLVDHVVAHGCSRRRVRVIPCGVARDSFPARVQVRASAGRTEPFVVGFLGSLKPWHGVEILLKAFGELLESNPCYRLLVVGDGPLRGMVDGFRRSRPDRVTITGEVAHRDVPSYLAQMDVGVAPYPPLPTFYFSPLKIFEYAAAGIPIVASASGQIADVLVHRHSAMLHPPGKWQKVVLHIERLRARPELRLRLARRARRVVAEAYTWDRLAARFLSITRNCVASMR